MNFVSPTLTHAQCANIHMNMDYATIWNNVRYYLKGFNFWFPCHTLVPSFRVSTSVVNITLGINIKQLIDINHLKDLQFNGDECSSQGAA